MRQFDCVICDLDGSLVDTEDLHAQAWNMLLANYGYSASGAWSESTIGLPDADALDLACGMFPELKEKRGLLQEKQGYLRQLVVERGRELVYPGVEDRLRKLQDAGVKLAVGTNSVLVNTQTSLNAAGLMEFFPVIVTIDMVERAKPFPDIYRSAAEKSGVEPSRCVVVEDSIAGIASGKAAGCHVIGVTNTWPAEKLGEADAVFSGTDAALDWVLERSK